jgi:hypothetical protein
MNVPVRLWDEVEQLGEILEYHDRRGVRSALFRESVSENVHRWREHPYICLSARHIVFVSRDGHMFHWLKQKLKLNDAIRRLPCVQEMKPEKRADFLLRCDPQRDQAEWLRSHWLINSFTARDPATGASSCRVDREGTFAKRASLEMDLGPGRTITREHVIGLQDYVQWKESGSDPAMPKAESDFDRIDLPIEIPTRNLQVKVVVDTALYRSSRFVSEREIPELGMESRNLEGTRFDGSAQDPENPIVTARPDRSIDDEHRPKAGEVLSLLRGFRERIISLARTDADDGRPVLSQEERARVEAAFKLPDHFLSYELEWPSTPFGIAVCVRWEKPVRQES